MDTNAALALMVKRIVDGFKPEKIILFGSQARGDARHDSDYDLLVVMSSCVNRKATTVSIMRSLSDLPVSKDIVVTTPQELETRGRLVSSVLYPALQEGQVVYAR